MMDDDASSEHEADIPKYHSDDVGVVLLPLCCHCAYRYWHPLDTTSARGV